MTFQGDIAGSTYSISYLAKGLADRGHQVYLGARTESLLYQMLENTPVKLLPMTFTGKWDRANMRQIKEAVGKHDIHLVNAQSSRDRYSSIFARWLYGLDYKLVHTRRQVSKSMGGPMNLFYEWGTDKFVAVSQGVKDSLVAKGMKASHIKVIHNGTPEEKYQHIDPERVRSLKKKFAIKEGDFVIGCVSRKKGQVQLLKALQHIDRPVKLIMVGVESGDPEYDTVLQTYTTAHEVFMEGTVPQQEVLAYYKIFDLKVLPSTMEGLSQSLLEAMFLEVPVLATAAAGNLDLIRDGVNGVHFQDGDITGLADKVRQFMQGDIDVHRMIGQARKDVREGYSMNSTIDHYERFFETLVSGGKV